MQKHRLLTALVLTLPLMAVAVAQAPLVNPAAQAPLITPIVAQAPLITPVSPFPAPVVSPAVANCSICMYLKTAPSPFTTFSNLLDRANIYEALAAKLREGPLTVFAPRDGYINRHLDGQILAFLRAPENLDILQRVLMFHIAALNVTADSVATGTYATLSGDWLSAVRVAGGRIRLEGGSPVKIVNHFSGGGGFLSGVDGLLVPPAVTEILCSDHLWRNCTLAPGSTPLADASSAAAKALDALFRSGQYSTFLSAMTANNVDVIVSKWRGPITVLAPPDVAFQFAPEDVVAALKDKYSKQALAIVLHHCVPGYVTLTNAVRKPPANLTTLNDDYITVTSTAHFASFSGSNGQRQMADIPNLASAVGITTVLRPDLTQGHPGDTQGANLVGLMRAKGRFSKFLDALSYSGLMSLLTSYDGPLTVLAPVNESFNMTFTFEQQRLEAILLFHLLPAYYRVDMLRSVAPGNVTTLEGSSPIPISVRADGVIFFNGNDSFTIPDPSPSFDGRGSIIEVKGLIIPNEMEQKGAGAQSRSNQITDALAAAGNYSTLLSLMQLSSHQGLLFNPTSPVTLFAFSDAAMSRHVLNNGPDNGTAKRYMNGLEQLISYHIVEGYFTNQLLQGVAPYNLSTWSGLDVVLSRTNASTLLLNGIANIDRPDILAGGLISVQGIDEVLVPNGLFQSLLPGGADNLTSSTPANKPPHNSNNKPGSHGGRSVLIALSATGGSLALLALCCCCVALSWHRRKKQRAKLSQPKFSVGPNTPYSHTAHHDNNYNKPANDYHQDDTTDFHIRR